MRGIKWLGFSLILKLADCAVIEESEQSEDYHQQQLDYFGNVNILHSILQDYESLSASWSNPEYGEYDQSVIASLEDYVNSARENETYYDRPAGSGGTTNVKSLTKFCGPGNWSINGEVTENPYFMKIDQCCKGHDECPDTVVERRDYANYPGLEQKTPWFTRFASNEYTNLPRAQSFVGLMICAIFFPIVMLSFINHQEPRFLIPITLPLILLHAPKLKTGLCSSYPFKERTRLKDMLYNYVLCGTASARPLLRLWYTFNIVLTLFYGFVHQAGVYQLAAHMSEQLANTPSTTQTYLITSHIYDMPYCFLDLPSTNILVTNPQTGQRFRRKRTFFLSEYGSLPVDKLYSKVKLTMDMCRLQTYSHKSCHVYLAIPSSLSEDLNDEFHEHGQTQLMSHSLVKVFYAHLSMEAPPKLLGQHLCGINTDLEDADDTCSIYAHEDAQDWLTPSRMLKQFSSLAHQFGLALYEIKGKGSKPAL